MLDLESRFEARHSGICSIAVAIGVAGVASAGIGAISASNAASQQTKAEQSAQQTMQAQYQQTRSDLLPYNQAGQQAVSDIQNMSPFSFAPTQANLEQTPGYQFNLSQGLKAVQNSAAARGLGVSGAAQKGAAGYASGLADTTYQNQFSNALATYNQNLARQQQLAGLGESAAAQTGAFGTTTAANIGQTAVGIGNAQAAGTTGVANALSGGLGSIGNAFLYNNLLGSAGGGIYGQGGFSSGIGSDGQLSPFLYGAQ